MSPPADGFLAEPEGLFPIFFVFGVVLCFGVAGLWITAGDTVAVFLGVFPFGVLIFLLKAVCLGVFWIGEANLFLGVCGFGETTLLLEDFPLFFLSVATGEDIYKK